MADVLVDLYESEIWVPDRTDMTFNKAIEKGLSKVIVNYLEIKLSLNYQKSFNLLIPLDHY